MKTTMDAFFAKLAAAFLFCFGAQAQQTTPPPEQAPQLFSILDQNGDNQLSQDEAQGGLRDSFALIDSNGDTGIDLDELTRFLKFAAGGNGDPVLQPGIGFELVNFISQDEIIVWVSRELTAEEFNGVELQQGWGKNQSREGDGNSSRFLRSRDVEVDGPLDGQELFGSTWMHNATVIENNIPMDLDGLLVGNRIAKYHELTYRSGRTVYLLVSPENETNRYMPFLHRNHRRLAFKIVRTETQRGDGRDRNEDIADELGPCQRDTATAQQVLTVALRPELKL